MKSITQQFAEWVRTKPADEEYDPTDGQRCAFGQFGLFPISYYTCERIGIRRRFYLATVHQEPFTFGALATRLSSEQATS